ncbi:Deuterolysin metalloprotease (M35) family domain containing protein [Naviculisporaceae sp. PSN 640]
MKFAGIALFASMAAAVSTGVLVQRASPLSVDIKVSDNANVKAKITNTGKKALKLLKPGSILDKTAVEKTSIFSGADKVAFDGVRILVATSNLEDSAFQIIEPGETIDASWDAAQVHDLAAGGFYDIAVTGKLSYAEADSDSNDIVGTIPLSSNVVTTSIDGAAAAKVRRDFHESLNKRSIVQPDCTSTRLTATRNALTNCRALAAAASSAAATGPSAKMVEYFKSSTTSTRATVANTFAKIATECGSYTSGYAKYYCTDIYPACSSGVLAYTLPSQSYMVNCPLYFSALPALTSTCHGQDQATTTLHEVTHLSQIKGATDQGGCYGYSCVQSLTAAQNLNHADTYALFANAIKVGC